MVIHARAVSKSVVRYPSVVDLGAGSPIECSRRLCSVAAKLLEKSPLCSTIESYCVHEETTCSENADECGGDLQRQFVDCSDAAT